MKIKLSLLILNFIATSAGMAQDRIALVIGVQKYSHVPPLVHSYNDARDMAAALKSKGFQVETLYNPNTKREIKDAITRYYNIMKDKMGAVGILYYAGHGTQNDGENYLIPADASLGVPGDLDDECVKMNTVMSVLNSSNNLNIFLLDACRTNAFPSFSRDMVKGLAPVEAPKGSIVVFATQPGTVASDGSGTNGLFTSKLLKYINEPGLNIGEVFKNVKQDVNAESGGKQLPSVVDNSIGGDFYFGGTPSKGGTKKSEVPVNNPVVMAAGEVTYSTQQLNDRQQFFEKGKTLYDNKNYSEATAWFRNASELGQSEAQYYLGSMYQYGTGVNKDNEEARVWYRKSADQGNDKAQAALGYLYQFGNPPDYKEAFKLYEQAASHGNADAMNNLGVMYQFGNGIEVDNEEAKFWYRLAASKGHNRARTNLDKLAPALDYGYGTSDAPVVTIGKNVWLAKNLNVNKFSNGDPIPEAKTTAEWKKASDEKRPAWCYYDNDPTNGPIYGKLYNWYALIDPRGLAPEGWHIPSAGEVSGLGHGDYTGIGMKSTKGWKKPYSNGNGSNSSGFNGLPGGERELQKGKFRDLGYYGYWWNSSLLGSAEMYKYLGRADTPLPRRFYLSSTSDRFESMNPTEIEPGFGLSVRCVRD